MIVKFFKRMNDGKVFYMNPQKCIQNGGVSVVEYDWLISRFEIRYHSFESFCSCKIGR